MDIELSLNPNCSESVYRFEKADIRKLPVGLRSIKRLLELPGAWHKPEQAYSYSKLRPETEEQVCIYFCQTDCGELEQALIDAGINYMAEKPFCSSIKTKGRNLFESRD